MDGNVPLGGVEVHPRPVAQATMHMGVAAPPVRGQHDENLTFGSVAAHFTQNTSGSHAAFAVCVRRPDASVIGVTDRPLTDFCSDLRAVRPGTTLRWVFGYPPPEYVVMTLVPSTAGTARIDAVTFDYARSWRYLHQSGVEESAQEWVVHTT
jgi:hypothetical protein